METDWSTYRVRDCKIRNKSQLFLVKLNLLIDLPISVIAHRLSCCFDYTLRKVQSDCVTHIKCKVSLINNIALGNSRTHWQSKVSNEINIARAGNKKGITKYQGLNRTLSLN